MPHVTSPTWGPPPPCKQALRTSAWVATLSYAVVLCYDLVSRCRLSAF